MDANIVGVADALLELQDLDLIYNDGRVYVLGGARVGIPVPGQEQVSHKSTSSAERAQGPDPSHLSFGCSRIMMSARGDGRDVYDEQRKQLCEAVSRSIMFMSSVSGPDFHTFVFDNRRI